MLRLAFRSPSSASRNHYVIENNNGTIALISADADPPVDRPNLSKDYLAGEAQPDWIPLWPEDFYRDRRVDLTLNTRVVSIDTGARRVMLENGTSREFGALLIATGADPVRLPISGSDGHVHYLRSFADSRAIVERAASAKRALVVGASFIGLEVAASLRTRDLAVDIVAPDQHYTIRQAPAEAVGASVPMIEICEGGQQGVCVVRLTQANVNDILAGLVAFANTGVLG